MKRLIFFFLLLSLFCGTFIVMFSSHWFTIWVGLELSTLSILPILSMNFLSRSNEATLKYFLIQAFSAAMLLKGVILKLWISNSWDVKMTTKILPNTMMSFALIIKLGLAPCHFWFPDVLSGVSFLKGLMMACWQKMAPFFLILSLNTSSFKEILIICGVFSVIMGSWGGLNQTSMRKILAYSSMSHLGWIMSTSFFSQNMSFILFMFYMILKSIMFILCHKMNIKSLSSLNSMPLNPSKMMLFFMSILSLSGLPPLGGFIKKLLPIIMFKMKKNIMLLFPFLLGSLLSLFFYLRIIFKSKLILFPQHSLSLLKWRSYTTFQKKIFISVFFSFSLKGLILFPLFYSFM